VRAVPPRQVARRARAAVRPRSLAKGALALAAAALLGGMPSAAAAPPRARPRRPGPFAELAGPAVVSVEVPSAALHRLVPTLVYLPPGYPRARARYPTLVLLHGVPGSGHQLFAKLDLANVLTALVRARRMPPTIVVAPSDGPSSGTDTEWEDSPVKPSSRWGTFVADDLARYLQGNLPVCTSRAAHAIGGLSMGAFGAVNLALRHPDEYGAATLWSGYFVANTPAIDGPRNSPEWRDDSPLYYLPTIARRVRESGLRLSFYTGRKDEFYAENVAFARLLGAERIPYRFQVLPGRHSWRLWRAELVPQLTWVGAVEHC